MSKVSGTRLRVRRLETVPVGEVAAARKHSESWIYTMASLSEQLLIVDGHHDFHIQMERRLPESEQVPIPARVMHVTHVRGEGCKPGYCFVVDAVPYDQPLDPEVEFQAAIGGLAGAR